MLGLFGTLNLGARSLQTQQQGVEVAGHNLANVNNPAYARQRLQIATSNAIPTAVGWQGTGAAGTAINQLRDTLLDRQMVAELSVQGSLAARQRALQFAEANLGERIDRNAVGTDAAAEAGGVGSSQGISDAINGLFAAFQSVSTQPSSLTERQALLMRAAELTGRFNTVAARLSDLHKSLDESVSADVSSANALLAEIARLNDQVYRAETGDGSPANDLRDLRQQKLEELARFAPIELGEGPGGLNVSVSGQLLVQGTQVEDTIELYDAGGGQLLVRTATGSQPLNLTSGSLAGTIEARDGSLAGLRTALDASAAGLAAAVNSIHRTGFGLTGATGADFFTGSGAGDIAVNAALLADPALFQAAGVSGNHGDNQVALALAQLADSPRAALGQQTFARHFGAAVAAVGQSLAGVNSQQTSQQAVLDLLEARRNSVSGVSLDEEMTDMMKFQKAYTASARLVSTIDEMLETVVNMKR
ncbi:MAG: flagellar hook-associated protein FlgK [Verrucomicrobiota bacterium]